MQSQEVESDLIKDYDNPQSLVNLTPSVLGGRIAAIPEEILLMTDQQLEAKANVGDVERKLRAAWQIEYERAVRTGEKMEAANIYKGIVTKSYFHRELVGNSYKLAYIIKPFPDYAAQLEDMLQLGLDEMRKILKEPMVDEDGKFNHKLAALKANITEKLQDRARGAVTQKMQIDQKNMNLNITKDVTQATPLQMEAIDARLRELESSEAIAIEHKGVNDGQREV